MLFSCEKCGSDMVVPVGNINKQVYCPACQRIDSSQYFCWECWQTTGIRYYAEIMEDGYLRCNQCGRISKNPDLPQGRFLRRAKSLFKTAEELVNDLKFGFALVRKLRR